MRWWYDLVNDRIRIIIMLECERNISLLIQRREWRSVTRWRRMIWKNGRENNDNDDGGDREETK